MTVANKLVDEFFCRFSVRAAAFRPGELGSLRPTWCRKSVVSFRSTRRERHPITPNQTYLLNTLIGRCWPCLLALLRKTQVIVYSTSGRSAWPTIHPFNLLRAIYIVLFNVRSPHKTSSGHYVRFLSNRISVASSVCEDTKVYPWNCLYESPKTWIVQQKSARSGVWSQRFGLAKQSWVLRGRSRKLHCPWIGSFKVIKS